MALKLSGRVWAPVNVCRGESIDTIAGITPFWRGSGAFLDSHQPAAASPGMKGASISLQGALKAAEGVKVGITTHFQFHNYTPEVCHHCNFHLLCILGGNHENGIRPPHHWEAAVGWDEYREALALLQNGVIVAIASLLSPLLPLFENHCPRRKSQVQYLPTLARIEKISSTISCRAISNLCWQILTLIDQ